MHESLDQEIQTLQSVFWSERDPDGLAFASLADAFRRQGAVRQALSLLTDGMSRHPDFVTGHVIATRLYLDQGLHSEAELAARRVLELDPENLVGLSALATILAVQGDRGEAARHRATLMSVDPSSDEAQAVADLGLEPAGDDGPPPLPEVAPLDDEATGPAEITELVPETTYQAGSRESLLDDLTLHPRSDDPDQAQETADQAEDELSRAMDALGLVEEGADISPASGDDMPSEGSGLGGPETEFADLDALGSAEAMDDVTGRVDLGGPVDLAALAPDEPVESEEEVLDLAALAPDEPAEAEEEVLDLAALAPDEPAEAEEEVLDLAALAPDGPAEAEEEVLDLAALAPDEPAESEEEVLDLAALAPDGPAEAEEEVLDLAALAPDEPAESEEEVLDLAALAPDEPAESEEEVLDLAALAPDEPAEAEEEVLDPAALAPDEPAEAEEEVLDLAALAPDEPEEEVLDLAAAAPDGVHESEPEAPDPADPALHGSVQELADVVTEESLVGELDFDEPDDDEPAEPVYTRTLADLYVKQGFPDKALAVLKALQQVTPDDEDLGRRIAALEAGDVEEALAGGEVATPAETTAEGNGHSEDDVETRARELAEHGQDRPDDVDVDTPFAWNAGSERSVDGDDVPEGDESAAGSYFDALLEWEDRVQS